MARNVKKAGAGLGPKKSTKPQGGGKRMDEAMRAVSKKYAPAGKLKDAALKGKPKRKSAPRGR